MFSTSIAQLVGEADRKLLGRGKGALRLEPAGRLVILRSAVPPVAPALVEAGAAVFDLRASAQELGLRVEADVLPAGDPSVWATLEFLPRRPRERAHEGRPPGPRLLASPQAGRDFTVRDLVAVCERGAAQEGVSLRVAPMPLPSYFGLVLRARGHEPPAWFALGQAWAGIERLAQRCGWSAHLRMRTEEAQPGRASGLGARVEVWVLRRTDAAAPSVGGATFAGDEWIGF